LGLSILATFPQLYQILKTGLVRDHHPWTPALAIVANFVLGLHGLAQKDFGLAGFAAWFVLYNSVILFYKRQEV
jgi:hypothetical protein